MLADLQRYGVVLLIVDQPATIGALPVAVAQAAGALVGYLPGLAMRRIADLHPGEAKTDARDAAIIADTARTRANVGSVIYCHACHIHHTTEDNMTTPSFHTITTAVHATEGREQINRENLGYRQQELTNVGRYGYILISTVTVSEPDGVTRLIDPLMRVNADD